MPAGGRGAHSLAEPRGSHQTPNPLELLSSYFNKPSRGLAPYLNKLSRQLTFFYPPRHSSLSTSHANKSPPQQLPRGVRLIRARRELLPLRACGGEAAQGPRPGQIPQAASSHTPAPGAVPSPRASGQPRQASPQVTHNASSWPSQRAQHHSPHRRDTPSQRAPAPQPTPQGHPIPKSPSTTACAAGTPLTASSEGLAQRSLWPRLCSPSQASGAGSTQRGGQGARALPEAQASAPVP